MERGTFLGDRSVELLTAAAPAVPVLQGKNPWHGTHARADLPDARCVQYAYLFPTSGARLSLDLYPGDTLGQARVLYRGPPRVERLLELRDQGWEVRPNFHFGFMEKGLTWTRSSLAVDEYVRYWVGRIDSLGAFRREDWESELGRLVQDGIFDSADLDQFARDFTTTKRQEASPRPGLALSKVWPLTEALDPGFAQGRFAARSARPLWL